MKFSRRGFVAGLATASALAVPSIWQIRQRKAEEELARQVAEPSVEAPTLDETLLAARLVGIWDFRLLDGQAAFPTLAVEGLELLLDVGPSGRAVQGYLGVRPFTGPGLQVFADLDAGQAPRLRCKLLDAEGRAYGCTAIFDEIWGDWSAGGAAATLSGQVSAYGAQPGHSTVQARFLATRRPFVQARERLHYTAAMTDWLISPGFRLFHQLWHATRDRWHRLDASRRQAVRALDWQPGPLGRERDARGRKNLRNGSGEDFLFMHRDMLLKARQFQALPAWRRLPPPRPCIGHGLQAFVDYLDNRDGYSVPPAWEAPGDDAFNLWLRDVKSSEGFFGNFQRWEAQYQDPEYLSTLCLGEFGARIELGIHDWLHMRWAAVGRDPNSGRPMIYDRAPADMAERWFRRGNDYLADPFSSHVNPVFWAFHGWIDDRLEDWFLAHEQAHPGEVVRTRVNGVPWFAPGPWVEIAEPWLGPGQAGCGAWGRGNGGGRGGELDIETMKLALHLILDEDEEADRLFGRVPRRPWYGRYLPAGPR